MEVSKPIFIVGVGRSGSTVFHDLVARHPRCAWFSTLMNRYPERPAYNRLLLQAIRLPLLGSLLLRRAVPIEAYEFWEHHAKGFRRPCRDLEAADVTVKVKETLREVLAGTLTRERDRLLVKLTGWPRMAYLREIFKDAKFVHMVRDGRAVVNSMINVPWWHGWSGPHAWRWGELNQSQRQEWEAHGRSFIALAAIQWKILQEAMDRARQAVGEDAFMEVRYEDLCAARVPVLRGVLSFCELEWTSEFEAELRKQDLRNTNYKWRKELTAEQQGIVEEVAQEYLERYGYLEPTAGREGQSRRDAGASLLLSTE